MVKNGFKLRFLDIIIFLAILPFFKPIMLPSYLQIAFKISAVVIVLIYIFVHFLRRLINFSLILVLPIAISGVVNYMSGRLNTINMLNGILFAIAIYCSYTVFEYCNYVNYGGEAFNTTYKIIKFFSIVSVFSIIIQGADSNEFFFGSKFPTGYLLMLFVALYYIKNEQQFHNNQISFVKFCALTTFVFCVIWWIGCRTASIGLLVFFCLAFMTKSGKKILSKPVVVIFALLVSASLVFIIDQILKTNIVQHVLTILGKDPTMSDRLRYYQRIGIIIASGNKFWGYGYESDLLKQMILYGPNIQNGVLQHVVQYGLFGGVTLFAFVYGILKTENKRSWGYYMFIYAMIVTAIVEISISYAFFLGLFAMKWLSDDNIEEWR